MPPISNGTTSPSKTHRIDCSGRTQRSSRAPAHRLRPGKPLRSPRHDLRHSLGVARPCSRTIANHTRPSCPRAPPACLEPVRPRRKPPAPAPARPTRGPLRSPRGRPAARQPAPPASAGAAPRRCGSARRSRAGLGQPLAAARCARSLAARACMRAGISSENSSSSSSAMRQAACRALEPASAHAFASARTRPM